MSVTSLTLRGTTLLLAGTELWVLLLVIYTVKVTVYMYNFQVSPTHSLDKNSL